MYQDLIDFLDKINGAHGWVIVFFSGIGFGYVLKSFKRFPNAAIPLSVVGWCSFWNPMLADVYAPPQSLRLWLGKNALLGFLYGVLAWMTHRAVLKRIDDKIPWLRKLNDSDTYKKGQPGWEPQVVSDPAKRIQDPPTLQCGPCETKIDPSSDSAKGGH